MIYMTIFTSLISWTDMCMDMVFFRSYFNMILSMLAWLLGCKPQCVAFTMIYQFQVYMNNTQVTKPKMIQ